MLEFPIKVDRYSVCKSSAFMAGLFCEDTSRPQTA